MSARAPSNSTNVRFLHAKAAPALLALALWTAFVALLQVAGGLSTLGRDACWLAGFACGVAALAYAVDGELRSALCGARPATLLGGEAAAIALTLAHPAGLLAFSPAAVLFSAALLLRPRALAVSSTAAASPGAKPGAL
jgi:hypothetical protein